MTENEWDKCFLWLVALFPTWPASPVTSATWHRILPAEAKPADFQAAVKAAMGKNPESAFPPPISDIKARIDAKYGLLPPNAMAAWDQILLAVQRGSLQIPKELPEAAGIAVRACGGMRQIGLTDDKDLKWVMKSFIACYESMVDAGRTQPLASLEEGRKALPNSKVNVLVGNVANQMVVK